MDVRFDHFIIEYYLAIVRRKTTHDPPWSSWMPAVSILKTCWCNLNEIKLLESRTSKCHSVYNYDMHQTLNAKNLRTESKKKFIPRFETQTSITTCQLPVKSLLKIVF